MDDQENVNPNQPRRIAPEHVAALLIGSVVFLLGLIVLFFWPAASEDEKSVGVADLSVTEAASSDVVSDVVDEPKPEVADEVASEPTVTQEIEESPSAEDQSVESPIVEEPSVEEPKAEEPKADEPSPEVPSIAEPKFDLVRVDKDGAAVIAGVAEPGGEIMLKAGDVELGKATVASDGTFVFLLDLPKGEEPLELGLETVQGEKAQASVLVMPVPKDEPVSPKIVIADAQGAVEVQPQGELGPKEQSLSLDTINYTETGDVVLAGRASEANDLRIYVDNEPVVLGLADEGNWEFEIPNIEEGIYTLRIDALDETGTVVERVESPFQRVIAEMAEGSATIQPGFTLWKLAELKYGSGDRYIQIVEANRAQIKDPNLIYPGQVFEVPE